MHYISTDILKDIFNVFDLFQIDVNSSLEKQGPLHVFLHKLTDTQSHAESGDKNVSSDENVIYNSIYTVGNINDQ